MLRRHRERAPRPHPEDLARAGARHAALATRGTPDRRRASPRRSTMSACWRSRCSWCATAAAPLLVNEIAPRVHNSGHWTIDGAGVAVRAAYPRGRGLAAGATGAPRPPRRDDQPDRRRSQRCARWLTVPGASVHLYGKGEARPGRKMGHVTRVWPRKMASAEPLDSRVLTVIGADMTRPSAALE